MKNQDKRILFVEDNEKIMHANIRKFMRAGYETAAAPTLAAARLSISERTPDAVVLDIMMPDGSGLKFMQELREGGYSDVPVLLLTGLGAKEDVVRGLAAGGDDYLTKPYDFEELLARVEALLRRTGKVPEIVTKGRLSLNLAASAAILDQTDLLLAQKEFALLFIFVQNEDRHISAEYLYEKVWRAPMAGDNHALKSAISRLREKIKGSGWKIEWSRGEGYSFVSE